MWMHFAVQIGSPIGSIGCMRAATAFSKLHANTVTCRSDATTYKKENAMKKDLAHAFAATLVVALFSGCASAPPSIDSSPTAEVTFDGLNDEWDSLS